MYASPSSCVMARVAWTGQGENHPQSHRAPGRAGAPRWVAPYALAVPIPTVRIAFLGAAQSMRGGGWVEAVKRRTSLVFPSRSRFEAVEALRQELDVLGRVTSLQLNVVGYSWGGWTALDLVRLVTLRPERVHRNLAAADLRVTLGTLDPVGTLRFPVTLPDDERIRAWNVYQRNGCHHGCPGPAQWFAGRPVEGAIENLDITEEGRGRPGRDGVPPDCAPDHIQVGYLGWGGYDDRVASLLE